MTQHTEGPWKYENVEGKDRFGFPHHLHRVAQADTNIVIVHMENTRPEDDHNARLIAAAPELLAALKLAARSHEELVGAARASANDRLFGPNGIAHAAIAKATS